MPHFALWQWLLGGFSAFTLGAAKSGLPGGGTLAIPMMVLVVGSARFAAAWTAPILSTGDVFAVFYWRRHAEARKLLSLIPWVVLGGAGGAFALSLDEQFLRRTVATIVAAMLILFVHAAFAVPRITHSLSPRYSGSYFAPASDNRDGAIRPRDASVSAVRSIIRGVTAAASPRSVSSSMSVGVPSARSPRARAVEAIAACDVPIDIRRK